MTCISCLCFMLSSLCCHVYVSPCFLILFLCSVCLVLLFPCDVVMFICVSCFPSCVFSLCVSFSQCHLCSFPSLHIRLDVFHVFAQVMFMFLVFHHSYLHVPAQDHVSDCFCHLIGYYSFRETKKGSWYIQALCEMLRKYGSSLEFTELLTLVNRKVSMRNVPKSCDPQLVGKKQMPCFASMLTKKLYFRLKK